MMLPALPISEAREELGSIVSRVCLRGDRVVLSKNGKPVAAVISMQDLELLQAAEDRADLAAVDAALAEPGGVSLEQLRADLKL